MTYKVAVLMGILQGVAEFLPISSSGHLALFQHFFGVEALESAPLFFTVMLHFGTLMSVFICYRREIGEMIREFFAGAGSLLFPKYRRQAGTVPPARRMVLLILAATLPLFLVLPVKGQIERAAGNVTFVSVALLTTGVLLYASDRTGRGKKTEKTATVTDALLMGAAQCLGTLPGISRSGSTISAGLFRGYERGFAVRFSFLMSLPAVLGATVLELKEALEAGLEPAILPFCLVGMAVSAVVGCFAIRLVHCLTERGKFGAFAYYCWAAGLLSLVANSVIK